MGLGGIEPPNCSPHTGKLAWLSTVCVPPVGLLLPSLALSNGQAARDRVVFLAPGAGRCSPASRPRWSAWARDASPPASTTAAPRSWPATSSTPITWTTPRPHRAPHPGGHGAAGARAGRRRRARACLRGYEPGPGHHARARGGRRRRPGGDDLGAEWRRETRQRWVLDTDEVAEDGGRRRPDLARRTEATLRIARLRAERDAVSAIAPEASDRLRILDTRLRLEQRPTRRAPRHPAPSVTVDTNR